MKGENDELYDIVRCVCVCVCVHQSSTEVDLPISGLELIRSFALPVALTRLSDTPFSGVSFSFVFSVFCWFFVSFWIL